MRKAIISVSIAIAITIFLTACGGGKPDDVSEEMYQKAIYIVKVCDLYLNGETTQEETKEKIRGIDISDFDITSASVKEVEIWSGITGLHADCTRMFTGSFDLSSFKEHRDKIAEAINYK